MERDLKRLFKEYMTRFRTMAVATSNGSGRIDCATVYFAADEDGRIFFGADQDTLKVRHLRTNPSVAAAFSDDGASSTGLQIRGKAEELTDRVRIMLARNLLKQRDERSAAFFDNPNVVFFEVRPEERFLVNFAWGVDWRNAVPS